MPQRLLAALVAWCQARAPLVVLGGFLLVAFAGWYAAGHLGVSTDTDAMFAESLPWRQRQKAMDTAFPQAKDLVVIVVDGAIPEEADATANALLEKLQADTAHFHAAYRPDASPYLTREGLLFLDPAALQKLMDGTIDAQPFLGQLNADPSARGLFAALGLIGLGVQHGQADLGAFGPALGAFDDAMRAALDGHPKPLSWQSLLARDLSDLGGQYRFVLAQPVLDFGALQPGGAATDTIRADAAELEFVRTGTAHVRITGPVALADEEFATVAQGALYGLLGSLVLIAAWLFLAVRSWRLMLPVLGTLVLGLLTTLLFASAAIGTLNVVSVGFGILFVGIAVDFSIQFTVRFREVRFLAHGRDATMGQILSETGRRAGVQILVAAAATAAGFLAFVPTKFSGVAELGLVAGVGMLIAFACTLTFLPAAISVLRPRGEAAEVGFVGAAAVDRALVRARRWVLGVFAAAAVAGVALSPRIGFDSDPLHTKDPTTEAVRTLRDLSASPLTNPYTIDILAPNVADADALAAKLRMLPDAGNVLTIDSLVPEDQGPKLAILADAASVLGATLSPQQPAAPVTAQDVRLAARAALDQLTPALPKLPADSPVRAIADDLKRLASAGDDVVLAANASLTRFLPAQIAQLRAALGAKMVTRDDVPAELKRDWLLADGRARVQVVPKAMASDAAGLRDFVRQVAEVTPDAGGSAVTIVATADTIVGAFRSAAIGAVVAIAVILFLALRRVLDVGLVMAPLLLSSLMTVIVVVLVPLPINFANIIALPLLLGVGVSFNIYFVMNWRAGRRGVLASATARAVTFSALTTGSAFGTLALSRHPGTASMGTLLLVSLACTLLASLVFIPALLASLPANAPADERTTG